MIDKPTGQSDLLKSFHNSILDAHEYCFKSFTAVNSEMAAQLFIISSDQLAIIKALETLRD